MKINILALMISVLWLLPSTVIANDDTLDSKTNPDINKKVLTKAMGYLNEIKSLRAKFIQVAPDGEIASGTLYLERPGKMRWQYDPPVPVVMVSQGSILRYYDYELDQISDIPIRDSLAGFLAREHIDFFDEDIHVLKASKETGEHYIRVTYADNPDEGKIAFVFEQKPYHLRNLIIEDKQGKETNISLSNATYNLELDDELFEFMGGFNQPNRYQRR